MPVPIAFTQRIERFIQSCRRPGAIAMALLLLGTAARLRQYLAVSSYWHDEAYLLLNVFAKSFLDLVGPLSHDQAAPPLFLWILRGCYLALGPAELAMRLPALLASLTALVLMLPLARAVAGRQGWLFAVGCAALSSSLLYLTYQVKPYTTDVLATEAILLATVCGLKHGIGNKQRLGRAGLVLAALLGPWLSFPSTFVTGAACCALMCRAIGSRWRKDVEAPTVSIVFAAILSVLLLASCLALWLLAARYHNTDYQQSFWAADFVDLSGPGATAMWLVRKLVEAGNYGVQGTGLPVALLAAVGLASCWRQQPWLALILVLPVALACLAAAARCYPLGNRLLAFLLPCLWLLAAQGMDAVLFKLRRRGAWVAAMPALLLLPAAVYTARYSVFAKPSVEFRQALTYIHNRMRAGDSLWVSQPEVHEVYFGQSRLLDKHSPAGALAAAAQRGRVWLLCHPPSTRTGLSKDARRQLEACGAQQMKTLEFVHLDVMVFSSVTNRSPPRHTYSRRARGATNGVRRRE